MIEIRLNITHLYAKWDKVVKELAMLQLLFSVEVTVLGGIAPDIHGLMGIPKGVTHFIDKDANAAH
ncbi:hypothetical protein BVG16_31020 [Paenibacillus selenitireducens]|uniref:Uncharacterized protein n=1 Tax=Paenibacillus selenitireducens TaxID=1324314 RepID=A0A1T2WZG2_9BACL|nr:hypothetical protein [Paenibacillus selenitireducens]OPA72992.1 hypothetical protein BVG16_31020 [Paenibacillus selenitireducens]